MKIKWRNTILGLVVLAGLTALLIWAFLGGRKERTMEQERERPVEAPSRVSIRDGESVVTLDAAAQTKIGITVAALKPVSHREEIKAYGTVLQLQDLIDLHNAYVSARAEVEKTQATVEVSRKAYERLSALHEKSRNISDKALQTAEGNRRSDEAGLQAAEAALSTLEGTARQRWGGVVAKWLIDEDPALHRLVQQQDLLIQITLPADAQKMSASPTAWVQAAGGVRVSARLISPSPRTDPVIQGVSFFYLVPAERTELLPGMNLLASLPVGSPVRGVVVPVSAVVYWQGRAWVYVQKEPDRFVRIEISTEAPSQNGWFVSKNLSAGDRIVVSGAQLLLSEEFRSQIQVGEEGGRK